MRIFHYSLALLFYFACFFIGTWFSAGAEEGNNLKIAVIAPLTGEFARIGQDSIDAIRMAVTDYESKNRSSRVMLIIEDDGFSIPKALSAYKKITALDKINAMLSVSSTAVSAIGDDLSKDNIPTAQVFLETESKLDSIVQICPDMQVPERELGRYVKSITKGTAVLIVPTNETWLKLAEAFKQGYGSDLIVEQVPVAEYDLKAPALKVRNHNPDRVIILMAPEQGSLMLRELTKQLSANVEYAFDANFFTDASEYNKDASVFARIVNAPVLTLPTSESSEFRKAFKERFNREAGPWAEYSYDAARVLLESYDSNSKTWIKNMHTFVGEGYSGKLAFDQLGVRQTSFEIKTVAEVTKR